MNHYNLRLIRQIRGYSQRSLSEAIGVAQGTVAMWETGKRNPTTPTLQKISQVLNCSADLLLQEENISIGWLGGNKNG